MGPFDVRRGFGFKPVIGVGVQRRGRAGGRDDLEMGDVRRRKGKGRRESRQGVEEQRRRVGDNDRDGLPGAAVGKVGVGQVPNVVGRANLGGVVAGGGAEKLVRHDAGVGSDVRRLHRRGQDVVMLVDRPDDRTAAVQKADGIVAVGADDRGHAGAADNLVLAAPTIERVGAGAAEERVVALAAEKRGRPAPGDEGVIPRAPVNVHRERGLDGVDVVVALEAEDLHLRDADGRDRRRRPIDVDAQRLGGGVLGEGDGVRGVGAVDDQHRVGRCRDDYSGHRLRMVGRRKQESAFQRLD